MKKKIFDLMLHILQTINTSLGLLGNKGMIITMSTYKSDEVYVIQTVLSNMHESVISVFRTCWNLKWRHYTSKDSFIMMTSSNGKIFHVTGLLWGESTGHQWIPPTKSSDAELWCFLWSVSEQTVQQTIETPVIWDVIMLIMMSL